jgi:hypothetical protein
MQRKGLRGKACVPHRVCMSIRSLTHVFFPGRAPFSFGLRQCLEAGDTSSYAAGMREAALHAAAGRCPNIVALTDAFEHRSSSGRHPVMVLEPCGTNLLHVSVG